MAEDGMLLNFALDDGPLAVKPIFKGGRWKDRLTAKKTAQHQERKRQRPAVSDTPKEGDLEGQHDVQENDGVTSRPAKRQRGSEDGRPRVHAHKPAPQSNGVHANEKPSQVISSLFTSNPASTTRTDQAVEEADVEASNAPLAGELETFTSLGLSPTLANHMLRKLDIKAPTAIQKTAIAQLLREHSDAFLQAETGSGKTLAYLLPLVQKILALSASAKEQGESNGNGASAVHRDSGLFAIVLAPTRELSKQILVVLESILRCASWIVPCAVIGGEKRKSEKARLRKGVNILVATPGRLADHLENTAVLDVGNVRWVVLDEGDRLMELGLEEDILKILSKLDAGLSTPPSVPGLPAKRMTVLCSATMKMNVQRLGEISLKEAVHIQANTAESTAADGATIAEDKFSAPAQLKQSYAVVPAKLRLVTLLAVLKRAFARKSSVLKVIVFISCADSVDFHFHLFARPPPSSSSTPSHPSPSHNTKFPPSEPPSTTTTTTFAPSPLLTPSPSSAPIPHVTIHRLHGSLPQPLRTATLRAFTTSPSPSVLLTTDVASRGLDLPNLDLVLEYDPAFSAADHLHRIGRTARAGRAGRACVFLMPGREEGYVRLLREMHGAGGAGSGVRREEAEGLMRRGFAAAEGKAGAAGNGKAEANSQSWEAAATSVQLEMERWVLGDRERLESARRAFQSHVRAYATHVVAEREWFDMRELHLGHLAKAFGLRDRPGGIGGVGLTGRLVKGKRSGEKGEDRNGNGNGDTGAKEGRRTRSGEGKDGDERAARRKMDRVARFQAAGAGEFNIG